MDGWSHWERCPVCLERAPSLEAMVAHLDKWHIGWVQEFLRKKGFTAPDRYPIREFRLAVAALLVAESAPDVLH